MDLRQMPLLREQTGHHFTPPQRDKWKNKNSRSSSTFSKVVTKGQKRTSIAITPPALWALLADPTTKTNRTRTAEPAGKPSDTNKTVVSSKLAMESTHSPNWKRTSNLITIGCEISQKLPLEPCKTLNRGFGIQSL